jgi:hypothetical protein
MKYTMESLDYALETVMPNIALAKKAGVDFNRPVLIKMAAYDFFLNKEYEDRREFSRSMCYHVIWEAAQDLEEDGFFLFGGRNLKQELGVE